MNPWIWLVGGVAVLAAAGGAASSKVPTIVGVKLPLRIPPTLQALPPTPEGVERNDDVGRAWGEFYVNRNAKKHFELLVLRVAGDAGNADIGTGEVIADVYETVIASADWEWSGQACEARRFRLVFSQGHLVRSEIIGSATPDKPLPTCQGRPTIEVYRRNLGFVQRGPDVFMSIDTRSGLNMRSPDRIGNPGSAPSGYFAQAGSSKKDPEWDNDAVASGDLIADVSWIFTPT